MLSRLSQVKARIESRCCALAGFRRDQHGTTAIEFAMVAAPFFLFAFAIMGIGLQFFTMNALEHGVENAARKIRTGQIQAGHSVNGVSTPYTNQDFKQMVCDEAGSYIDCSKLVVHINSGDEWANVSITPCLTAGNLTASSGNASDSVATKTGGASKVVLVTVCYQWDLGGSMWQSYWNLLATGAWADDGDTAKTANIVVMQAVSTFRTEPYN